MENRLEEIKTLVVEGKHQQIEEQVKKAVDAGVDLNSLINDGLIAAMDIVGKRFSASEIFVPEMLVSAMTMKKGLEIVKPLLASGGDNSKGTVLIGTVKGDLHDIGKNLVSMMLEGAGYRIVDMGVDVKVEDVIATILKEKAEVLGLSALLTTTLPGMGQVIEALKEAGLRDKIKVMVGGAPVDQAFADKIGADGYAADAAEAVELTRRLMAA